MFATLILLSTFSYPNPSLTPGDRNPVLTRDVICSSDFRTAPYRNVPDSLKKKVFEEYGIAWEDRGQYEVDHLISLELGGSNSLLNLWPEPWKPKPGAKEKDVVENYLHKQVCGSGEMSLEEAQKEITEDWYAVYERIQK